MYLLKRIVRITLFISCFIFFIPVTKEIKYREKVDKIINNKKENMMYEGYIYIPKFNYKSLIKKGASSLDENLVELTSFSDNIGEKRIILAGHNNKYVFNKIYYLNILDEIIISDFKTDYKYVVKDMKYIKVDDYSNFNDNDSLTLITCTNNNQERYIVIAKRE